MTGLHSTLATTGIVLLITCFTTGHITTAFLLFFILRLLLIAATGVFHFLGFVGV